MECRLPGISVHYECFGSGRPLVILPGWPDDWTVPADYLEPVLRARRGWRRIYLDLPGRGLTKGEPWIDTNDQVLEIILGVLDHVIPGERFVVAGQSAGAYLARAVLHRRAALVEGLLQVVPVIDPGGQGHLPEHITLVRDPALLEQIRVELGPEVAAVFTEGLVVQSPDIYRRFKALLPGMLGNDAAFLSRLEESVSFEVDRLRTPFAGPALFVLGKQDARVGYRDVFELTDQYPRGTVAVLDRAGHALPWEQETLFRALVTEWLERVEEDVAPAQ